jgi:DNA-binding XRE family transcriptional regulator
MERKMTNATSRAQAAMKRGAVTLKQRLEQDMKDPAFARAYRAVELEAQVSEQLRALREKKGMTQQQLADKVAMKREAVARIEKGKQNLTIGTIEHLASVMGHDVQVRLVPASRVDLARRAARLTRMP